MLMPTLRITWVTMTAVIAVGPSWSQFGPTTPNWARKALMPPLSCRRKPQTSVHATTETTTGEKNRVRKRVTPAEPAVQHHGERETEAMFSTTTPPEKIAVAPSTLGSCGSSSRAA